MNLKKSDILQVNVTAIAGIMILLTISSVQTDSSLMRSGKVILFLAWVMILPFAVSSFSVIRSELEISKKLEITKFDEIKEKVAIRNSLYSMMGGFGYIIVFLGTYVILNLI